jgi:TPR repeat protein/serine/threonine protein kinase
LIVADANRIIDLLYEAKARPAGPERDQFLAQACGEDAALREQIVSLLQADAADGESDFLKLTRIIRQDIAPTEKPGDRIGRYKLLEQIGEGGCGVVYVAEQQEPVRRRVALKVIKLGMDTKQVIARFDAERQALAIMDHPNIAKVLDAGATGTGRPYFVMELVRGSKITDYCDQHQLSPRARLELFIQVCRAVQHAHQKGVMHRDIKPSNILVASDDGAPVPKVIDFGIAKATQGRLTDQTVYTAFEQFIGTPAYMSPEQAEMSLNEVDTRTDIYSLGVLLYELLTGKTPFDPTELVASGLEAMRRTIREKEPARPSTRLSTMMEGELTSTARQRHTEAPRLIHLLRGDLDWVVMKCLEKDRARRYETANGLAGDIQRHLNCEPVVARPPSRLYEFQKTVRRHKFGFAAAAALTLVLALGVLISTREAIRATHAERQQSALRLQAEQARTRAETGEKRAETEAARSEQVASFMKDMLSSVGPRVALGRDTKLLKEILDQTAQRLNDLKVQPEVESDLCVTLAGVYRDLGDYPKAEAMLRPALTIRKNLFGEKSLQVVSVLDLMGQVLHRAGKPDEAEAAYRQALGICEALSRRQSLEVASTLNDLGSLLRYKNKLDEAEAKLREGLALRRKLLPANDPEIANSLAELGLLLQTRGKPSEAEPLLREALPIRRAIFPPDDPRIADSLVKLGVTLTLLGKYAEAETNFLAALAIQEKVLGDHRDTANTLDQLGSLLIKLNRLPEAEQRFRESLAMRNKVFGDSASRSDKVVDVLDRQGKKAEVAKLLREDIAKLELQGGRDDRLVKAWDLLADNLRQQDQKTDAITAYRKAFELWVQLHGTNHMEMAHVRSMYQLGRLLESLGGSTGTNFAEAVEWYRKAAAAGDKDAMVCVGRLYEFGRTVPKDDVEAVKWYRRAAEGGNWWGQWRLGFMYENGNGVPTDATEAAEWYRKSSDGGNHDGSRLLGELYRRGEGVPKDSAQALKLYRKAAEQGDADVLVTLGVMYLHGEGVPTNAVEAQKWFLKAWEKLAILKKPGKIDPSAYMELAGLICVLDNLGKSAAVDDLFEEFGVQQNAAVFNCVARRYANGMDFPKDPAAAAQWYRKAAEQGDFNAGAAAAWILATATEPKTRDGKVAVSLAETAVAATNRKSAPHLDILAAAYAEIGEFEKAASTEKEAMTFLTTEAAKKNYGERLKLYESKSPYHDPHGIVPDLWAAEK